MIFALSDNLAYQSSDIAYAGVNTIWWRSGEGISIHKRQENLWHLAWNRMLLNGDLTRLGTDPLLMVNRQAIVSIEFVFRREEGAVLYFADHFLEVTEDKVADVRLLIDIGYTSTIDVEKVCAENAMLRGQVKFLQDKLEAKEPAKTPLFTSIS